MGILIPVMLMCRLLPTDQPDASDGPAQSVAAIKLPEVRALCSQRLNGL
jgi:hypothetical protein